MADLVLGPLLRYVSETRRRSGLRPASRARSRILGRREPTFTVGGHHYALVQIDGLEPGGFYEYDVSLDGQWRWPPRGANLPPSLIRTLEPGRPLDICFGSCRAAAPHERPYTLTKDEDEDGYELDALHVLAEQMIRDNRDNWPELLFLLGDQVYVDEGSPRTRERIRARRDTSEPPGEEVIDFEEYTWLYRESWQDPVIRWLFSTVSTSMVWDDHDMSDDWNISRSWHEEMERKQWWHQARDRRDHDLLDLPVHRQPLAAGAGRERALLAGAGEPRRDRDPSRVGARDRHHRLRSALELPPRHRRGPGAVRGLPRRRGS